MNVEENKYEREGGTAFPFTVNGVGGETYEADPGMTLRDYFAAQAISGVLQVCKDDHRESGQSAEQMFAKRAYDIADAMLAERNTQ